MNNQQQAKIIAKTLWRLSQDLSRNETDELTTRLFDFLKNKNKSNLIPVILEEVKNISCQENNQLLTEVWSRYALTENEQASIKTRLHKQTGRQAVIRHRVAEDIFGGLLIKYEDKVIDLTIKKQLENLEQYLGE